MKDRGNSPSRCWRSGGIPCLHIQGRCPTKPYAGSTQGRQRSHHPRRSHLHIRSIRLRRSHRRRCLRWPELLPTPGSWTSPMGKLVTIDEAHRVVSTIGQVKYGIQGKLISINPKPNNQHGPQAGSCQLRLIQGVNSYQLDQGGVA